MKLSDALKPDLVKVALQSEEKEEVFEEMVQLFVDADVLTDRDAALEAICAREAQMTTGIAHWLAIPHGKIEEASGLLVALGTSKQGIEYESLDGDPVYVVLMVFAEVGNPRLHIEALTEISRIFSTPEFTGKIRDAESVDEVLALIKQKG